MRSFIRYPGSKAKLAKEIANHFPPEMLNALWHRTHRYQYVEPFMGAGAVTAQILPLLSKKTELMLNDLDYWLVCLWQSVYQVPAELCALIDGFQPTARYFYEFKEQDGARIDPVVAGFRKLALHQISYSGLGYRAGGPLGGKAGRSEYDPRCRWRPERLKNAINALHRCLRRFASVTITCRDFSAILSQCPQRAFVYLDPPYFEKGSQLYKHFMEPEDHQRLADMVRRLKCAWVLSYDDHPRIQAMYSWASIKPLRITYTTATARNGKRPKNHEVLIMPKR